MPDGKWRVTRGARLRPPAPAARPVPKVGGASRAVTSSRRDSDGAGAEPAGRRSCARCVSQRARGRAVADGSSPHAATSRGGRWEKRPRETGAHGAGALRLGPDSARGTRPAAALRRPVRPDPGGSAGVRGSGGRSPAGPGSAAPPPGLSGFFPLHPMTITNAERLRKRRALKAITASEEETPGD
ncbi:unnamed protein product [Eretmochelys imbricata]